MNKMYIGVKIVEATPMTLQEYNNLREWNLPDDENGSDKGYLTKQQGVDGNEHLTWTPLDVFEASFKETSGMSFGYAIEAAREGRKIARKGWNGKGMFVVMMPELNLPPYNTQGTARKVNDRTAKYIGEDTPLNSVPYFAMFAANGDWVPGWLASQTDMISTDWEIVD